MLEKATKRPYFYHEQFFIIIMAKNKYVKNNLKALMLTVLLPIQIKCCGLYFLLKTAKNTPT